MSASKPFLVHIGYHKTGTTFLQTGLFSDPRYFVSCLTSHESRKLLVLADDFQFKAAFARQRLMKAIATTPSDGAIPVLSDERLSGSPHSGGFDSARIAHRLAECLPDAKLLIVIREQRDAIYSVYQQYVRDGGVAPLSRYIQPRSPAEIPQFRFEHYEYHHLIGLYQQLFGPEHVLVLSFEELREAPREFLRRIGHFVGCGEITSPREGERLRGLGAASIVIKRLLNRVLVRNALSPGGLIHRPHHARAFARFDRFVPTALSVSIESGMRRFIASRVGNRYRSSNATTVARTGLPLASFGYDLP